MNSTDGRKLSWSKAVSKAERFLGKRPFLGSFILALLLCSSILVFIKPFFEWDDDYYVRFLLKGVVLSSVPSELNYLENPLLCLFLKNLYGFFPGVEWYGSFFVFSQFLSVWALLAAFNLGTNRCLKSVLFIVGCALLEVSFITELQWTTVATSAAIGAFLLFAAILKKGKTRHFNRALGLVFVLCVISILVRPDSFLLIAVAGLPGFIYWAKKIGRSFYRRDIILFSILTAVVSLGLVAFDDYCYFQDDAWRNSLDIFKQHNELFDFRDPVYTPQTRPFFDSIGWSANDLALFKYDYFMDPGTYSLEKLRLLNDHFPQFGFDKSDQDTFAKMFADIRFQTALLFIGSTLFLLQAEAFHFILLDILWTAVLLCFCHWYLKLPSRIFLPCLFLLGNLSVFLVPKGQKNLKDPLDRAFDKLKFIPMILVFFFACRALSIAGLVHLRQDRLEQDFRASVKALDPQDDQIFVTWGGSFPYAKNGAFDGDGFLKHFHAVSLDWFQRSPTTQDMMIQYGLRNVFKDLVDNPKAFLICDPEELNLYRSYMNEKFGEKVLFQPYFNSAQFTVYRVLSVKK